MGSDQLRLWVSSQDVAPPFKTPVLNRKMRQRHLRVLRASPGPPAGAGEFEAGMTLKIGFI